MRFVQYGTRTYRRHTIIAFDFGAKLLELTALSNGPRDPERLYLLDLVARGKSFFWSHP